MATNTSYVSSATAAAARDGEGAAGLLRRLADDLTTLLRKELALATAEVSRSISDAKAGIGSVASGGAVLFGGFIALLAAAVLALSQVIAPWLAALIVGGITAIIGFAMVGAGKKKLRPESLAPQRAPESLRQDKEMLQRRGR